MQTKIQAVKEQVAKCIKLAEAKFNITLPQIDIRFDLRGKSAGQAGCTTNRLTGQTYNMYLRFNREHMQLGGKTWEHILNDTVPHEVAHTVCQAFPKLGRNHDRGWAMVCKALGGNGLRCYSQEDAPEAVAKARPYAYTTSTGHVVAVSPTIHSKIQKGAAYLYRGKGRISNQQSYTVTNASMLAAPTKPTAEQTAQPAQQPTARAGASNADQLRAYLTIAKRADAAKAAERTVAWAVETLGMTASLARTYVKNNWTRC